MLKLIISLLSLVSIMAYAKESDSPISTNPKSLAEKQKKNLKNVQKICQVHRKYYAHNGQLISKNKCFSKVNITAAYQNSISGFDKICKKIELDLQDSKQILKLLDKKQKLNNQDNSSVNSYQAVAGKYDQAKNFYTGVKKINTDFQKNLHSGKKPGSLQLRKKWLENYTKIHDKLASEDECKDVLEMYQLTRSIVAGQAKYSFAKIEKDILQNHTELNNYLTNQEKQFVAGQENMDNRGGENYIASLNESPAYGFSKKYKVPENRFTGDDSNAVEVKTPVISNIIEEEKPVITVANLPIKKIFEPKFTKENFNSHPLANLENKYPGFRWHDEVTGEQVPKYNFSKKLTVEQASKIESEVKFWKKQGLPSELADKPVKRMLEANVRNPDLFTNKKYMTVVDLRPTVKSTRDRMYILDRENGVIKLKEKTTHGSAKSNKLKMLVSADYSTRKVASQNYHQSASKFSNHFQSNASAFGLFRTDTGIRGNGKVRNYYDENGNLVTVHHKTAYSKHSIFLGLEGLDPTNYRSRGSSRITSSGRVVNKMHSRHLGVHNARYASGYQPGRSHGCNALSMRNAKKAISYIRGGSAYYVYAGF